MASSFIQDVMDRLIKYHDYYDTGIDKIYQEMRNLDKKGYLTLEEVQKLNAMLDSWEDLI